jgi:hypothetical protein
VLFTEFFHSSEGLNPIFPLPPGWESGRRLPHSKSWRHVRSGLVIREASWSAPALWRFGSRSQTQFGNASPSETLFHRKMTGNTKGRTKTEFHRWVRSQTGVWEPEKRGKVGQAFLNRLRLVDPASAFRIERVVNNKLTPENFVVR